MSLFARFTNTTAPNLKATNAIESKSRAAGVAIGSRYVPRGSIPVWSFSRRVRDMSKPNMFTDTVESSFRLSRSTVRKAIRPR